MRSVVVEQPGEKGFVALDTWDAVIATGTFLPR